MTTNEIEKQLKQKAKQQIREHVKVIVDNMAEFAREHTNQNRTGLRRDAARGLSAQRTQSLLCVPPAHRLQLAGHYPSGASQRSLAAGHLNSWPIDSQSQ